jgi:mevalonate kinase
MTEASAPGKIILCGEHAVVYGRPAIALPLADVRAHAVVHTGAAGSGITIDTPDLERRWNLADMPDHPLSEIVLSILNHLGVDKTLDLLLEVGGTIPIAGGMGSGAAVATALTRALAAHLGHELSANELSALVYTSEQRFHGTPSGIDNTVIAYEQPIWFARSQTTTAALGASVAATIEPISIAAPFTLLIGDTGIRSPTRLPVGHVRQRWQAHPARYEALFDSIGALVVRARTALAAGDLSALGALLDENHTLLKRIGVSSTQLNRLVGAARAAGALGAKLSGAGWGGVMIALVAPAASQHVGQALRNAGAVRVMKTTVAYHTVVSKE